MQKAASNRDRHRSDVLPGPPVGPVLFRTRWPAACVRAVLGLWLLLQVWPAGATEATRTREPDPVAENMLLLQTASGGWSKHYNGKAVDDTRHYDARERAALRDPARVDDATIDNKATTREIAYLAGAWQRSGDPRYLAAAERGVAYLLAAQYRNGGWPQFYPDRSSYRHQITLNDDAMTRVLALLQDIVEGRGAMAALSPAFAEPAAEALARGLQCLLATQVRVQGVLTIWAAQYDEVSLLPAQARSYELPALATSESVGVVRLLMRQPTPSPEIVEAVESAARWFEASRQRDVALDTVEAPGQQTGRDVVLVSAPGQSLWARFHDLEQGQPLFSDREGRRLVRLDQVPNERRVGYTWYGSWPDKLLRQELPRWRERLKVGGVRADAATAGDGTSDPGDNP
jgi:pectinesterase